MLRITQTLLVCLILMLMVFTSFLYAWDNHQDTSHSNHGILHSAPVTSYYSNSKIEPRKIIKCRPFGEERITTEGLGQRAECSLPMGHMTGWELSADSFFARTKGKVRFSTGMSQGYYGLDDIDMNADLGLSDHGVMNSFMAHYMFRPKWGLRYSVMPMWMMGSGQAGKAFVFGNTLYNAGQDVSMEWERLEQRLGLIYDVVHAKSSKISVFGDYVRVNERIKAMQMQAGMGGNTMDNDLNMGMAGIEFEKCLKNTSNGATLSLKCIAGAAFGDDAFGVEAETALKYSIPMNSNRWGFLKGGYRYVTYKRKSSDVRMFDTAMDGGFLQVGLVF